jgi:hypothetical protein
MERRLVSGGCGGRCGPVDVGCECRGVGPVQRRTGALRAWTARSLGATGGSHQLDQPIPPHPYCSVFSIQYLSLLYTTGCSLFRLSLVPLGKTGFHPWYITLESGTNTPRNTILVERKSLRLRGKAYSNQENAVGLDAGPTERQLGDLFYTACDAQTLPRL